MIIDFRVRPPFKSFCNLNIYGHRDPNPDPVTAPGVWLDLPPFRSFEDRSIERFVEEMDEAGIDVAVAMGRNSPAPWGSVLNSDVAEPLHVADAQAAATRLPLDSGRSGEVGGRQ